MTKTCPNESRYRTPWSSSDALGPAWMRSALAARMRSTLLLLIVAATSASAFFLRPQSAHFIGRVLSIEEDPRPNGATGHKEQWKAVVAVEKAEKVFLQFPVTNLTDRVCVYFAPRELLNAGHAYKFHGFLCDFSETNRLGLTVHGGSVKAL